MSWKWQNGIYPIVIVVVCVMFVGIAGVAGAQETADFDDAEPISEGETTGQVVDGSSDFYKLTANTTDALDVRLTPASADLEFRIYDQNREQMVGDGRVFDGDTGRLTIKLPETGTYYIEVTGDTADTTTDYTLDLDIVTPEENDEFAPNDDFDSAASIQEGISEAKVWGGESDFYKLTANTTDALDVRLTPESSDLEFRIYDENRQMLVGDGRVFDGNTDRLTIKLPETGTYYIEVNGDTQQATTNYTLDLDIVTPTENDGFAPNDDFDSAAGIQEGINEAKVWGGESDFYELTANTTDALDVRLTPESSDLEFRIYDQNREMIVGDGRVQDGSTDRLTVKLPETGTYYIEVTGDTQQATTNYTLNLDVVTPEENDDFAPNDDFDSAASIEEGFNDAKIWGGESDFYKLTANTTDALDVRLTPESSDLEFRIYDQNREMIVGDGRVQDGSTDRLTVKLPETGTYYLEVNGDSQQTTTEYTVKLDVVTPEENDDFAPNDDFDSAAPVTEEFTDAKVWGGESDYFAVGLNESEGLDLTLSPASEDLEFYVYGPNQEQLASDGRVMSGNSEELSIETQQTGNYYIEIAGNNQQTTTEYQLQSNRTGAFEQPELPAVTGENPPQDLNGDGRYRDIDGNGEFDIFDVQSFFSNFDSGAVQNNPDAFNFDGGENPMEVDIFDVQALFTDLQEQ